ncbi:hypothetical protein [Teichococcus aestuarii]|uniref:hypothetical protein n=1 Tax=Teichococcus aestuarii TaxID=568898 RepID=UPI003614DD4A
MSAPPVRPRRGARPADALPADETACDPCDAAPEEMDIAIAVDRATQALDIAVRRVEHAWAGLRSFLPDRSLAIGPAEEAGFFHMIGQGAMASRRRRPRARCWPPWSTAPTPGHSPPSCRWSIRAAATR